MPVYAQTSLSIAVDTLEISGFADKIDITATADVEDCTTYSAGGNKVFAVTLATATVDVEGFSDFALTGTDANLPLSGLFVQMLERLAVSTRAGAADGSDLAGQVWVPDVLLDGFGVELDAGEVGGIAGEALAAAMVAGPGATVPPGLYTGTERQVALNAVGAETVLAAAAWPSGTVVEGLEGAREQALKGVGEPVRLWVVHPQAGHPIAD